jgi:hypothetical protein
MTFAAGLAALAGCGGSATYSPAGSSVEAQAPAAPAVKPGGGETPIPRKIIYSATLEITVKNVDDTQKQVEKIIDEHKGYVAKSDVSGSVGTRRTATWTLKVPVEKFRPAVAALAALGNVVRNASDSQDVTEEYIDVQARVRNLKAEEETLNKLLKDQAVRLEDVLKIRDQIKNVRGEIERAEGRLKYLETMSAVSTITLTAREEATYDPAASASGPDFGDRVGNTFSASWNALKRFGEGIVLFLVALAPWLPLILVAGVVLWWLVRKLIRMADRPPAHRPDRHIPRARPLPAEERPPTSPGEGQGEASRDDERPSTGG